MKGLTFTPELHSYLVAHSSPETPHHVAIRRATERSVHERMAMQIPPEQGALLTMLVRLIGARRAIEVGTFTGYSALSIALGLPDDGSLTCCDVSEEWTRMGRPHWDAAGVGHKIDVKIAPALETLQALDDGPIDFAFIDADKESYVAYYEALLPRLRQNGLIVADNVLWGGAVLEPSATGNTADIQRFNAHLVADERVDVALLNVADGLTLIRKR